MTLQNRVDPFGSIVATPERGTLMGNRGGCFHDVHQELTRSRWKGRGWIACVLEFRGRRRAVMQPNRYTELFFLDEATALAAGHRPCAQCRWADFSRFKAAWLAGNPGYGLTSHDSIDEIDIHLHRERVDRRRRKVSFRATIDGLPEGSMIALDGSPGTAYLVWRGSLFRWSFEGYDRSARVPNVSEVAVLTPRSIVAAIGAGYTPAIHASLAARLPGGVLA